MISALPVSLETLGLFLDFGLSIEPSPIFWRATSWTAGGRRGASRNPCVGWFARRSHRTQSDARLLGDVRVAMSLIGLG